MNLTEHVERWNDCDRCPIGAECPTRVYFRGEVPAQILIVGEAPGDTEAVLEEPFVGPAGRLLDQLISKTVNEVGYNPDICFTNSIICIPQCDPDQMLRLRAPSRLEVDNCSTRLRQFIELVDPTVIITAGNVARVAVASLDIEVDRVHMIHPSAILRQGERGGLDTKRALASLKEAFSLLP